MSLFTLRLIVGLQRCKAEADVILGNEKAEETVRYLCHSYPPHHVQRTADMSLVPKAGLLTVEAIRIVLEEIIEDKPDPLVTLSTGQLTRTGPRITPHLRVPPWHGKWAKYFSTEDKSKSVLDFCEDLRKQAQDPETHATNIDAVLDPLLECPVYVQEMQRGTFEQDFVLRTYDILTRLPSRPLGLVGAPSNQDKRYLGEEGSPDTNTPFEPTECGAWSSLQVATFVSRNIIKMALYMVISGPNIFGNPLEDYPNALAEILEASSALASQCSSSVEQQHWYIVRAALWSSWQRSIMLYHLANLGEVLRLGLPLGFPFDNNVRSTTPSPGLSVHEISKSHAAHGKARAMCSWAFELLRTEPVCLGMDFRTFHQRYLQLWSNAPARCRQNSPLPCAGKDPNGCWRFKGMTVKDQSAHDPGCGRGCRKLIWDESSYRSASGARAVTIAIKRSNNRRLRLRYCSASENTLAISHVWSHGQGGRPHEGVNCCLHRRYVKIAKRLGCDSYWWDSACIPEDHLLRSEAIQCINGIFSRSKITLVCDKDLMKIDIANLTVHVEESILATVLVCDWNLRAWTFLESVRGRHNIYLLCKGNRTIPFLQVVRDVFEHGSIDLAILSLTVPHMFPGRVSDLSSQEASSFMMTREGSGQVLSYRPASRKGDDVVIWSLLANDDGLDSPEKLWQTTLQTYGNFVHTGFLMSSAPRLRTKGLSWAPSTPYFKSTSPQGTSFRAFDGRDTWPAQITDKGLLASWHVYEFETQPIRKANVQSSMVSDDQMEVLKRICSLYLRGFAWGALLRPMSNISTFERGRDTSTKYGGLIRGTLVAVLGSNALLKPSQMLAEDREWMWKCTFVWDEKVPLPTFVEEFDFLIE